jgi:hypothetical protein
MMTKPFLNPSGFLLLGATTPPRQKKGGRMRFQEFPWLIIGLFLRGEFGRNGGPNDRPIAVRSVIGVLAVLAVLILIAVCRVDC